MRSSMAALLCLGSARCLLPDISDTLDPGPVADSGANDVGIDGDSGEIVVDATDYDVWVGLDLDTLSFTGADDVAHDLAFKRFEVDLQEGLAAAAVEGVAFEDVTEVPEEGWRTDEPDADGDGIPEYALADWYDYDKETHTLSPADRIYVVETTEAAAYKLGFVSYYDDAGTPAMITLQVALLEEAP